MATKFRSNFAISVSMIALSGALITPSARAQDDAGPEETDTLDEITVTATRREKSLQDVGVAITAISGGDLDKFSIYNSNDLTNMTPGLQLIQSGGAPVTGLIAIRGVAQNDFALHLESANIVFSDDVYRPSNGTAVSALFDINRVETLKGPQGTLFGRNATGGLIHVISNEPTNELEGYAELTVGDFNQIRGEGAINVPLGDTAAFRVAVLANSNDGWVRNDIGPDHFADDTLALRAKLAITPNDSLRIKLQAEYYENAPNPAGGSFATGGFADPDNFGLGEFRRPIPAPTDTGYVDADGSPFTGSFNFDGVFAREFYTVFADISYQVDNLTFTSITSYGEYEMNYEEDNDLTPFDIAIFRDDVEQANFTQEFRVNADYEKLRVTGGVFYLDISGDYIQNYQLNNLSFPNDLINPTEFTPFPLGLNQTADYTLDTSSWSVFTQAEYDLTDRLMITGGLRYTRDQKDYRYNYICESLLGAPVCPPPLPDGVAPTTLAEAGTVVDEHSEGGFSARLQLDYIVNDDWLLYASYNRGYKAFSYNAGFAGAAPIDGVRFEGETLHAYEIGSKLDFLNNTARLNLAAYYYDYDDYQAFDQRGTSFVLFNTEARIYGIDAEFTWQPGYGIDLLLGGTYNNTTVFDVTIAGQDFDLEAAQAPEYTFNFGIGKTVVTKVGSFRLGFDGAYTDEYFSQLNNAPVTIAGGHWLVNTRLSFVDDDERWQAALFVRNLFDEARLQYAFDITFFGNGLAEQVFAQPRWFGAEFRVNF